MNLPDLWQLRYFVAVAEHLHFGRAAAALHISQPPLSRAIRALEERVGVRLFARSRRRVELTPEGTRLLGEARRVLGQLERTVQEVRGMARGEEGRLRIGFVSLADYGVLPELLKSFKSTRPGIALALREMLSPEQAAALAAGELDFGFLLPPVSGAEALEHIVVQRERFVAALPVRHRLATAKGKLAVSALADEPFVMVPRDIAPGLYDIVTGLAARAGISFNVAQEAIQMQTVVSLVSSGLGAAIVPGSIANLGRRGVVYRELADPHPKLDLWLAWPRSDLSIAARDFLALARRRAR
ncbi:MAG TPA: LysR family transcriptional regulator [Burkholderiales bacterium]|jgi:DNA-binding transcriptional LysR family regulator|nr:LysR family transcriptional regulator [Burkholderiales bacterium]